MITSKSKILLYGYGNPGRQDDGLGYTIAEEIERWCKEKNILNIDVTYNYQLNIEDAEIIAHYDVVIFVDASVETVDPFLYEKVQPSLNTKFTMHSVTPSFVVALSKQLFDAEVSAFQLHIKGEQWGFMEPISTSAWCNLELALDFIKDELESII